MGSTQHQRDQVIAIIKKQVNEYHAARVIWGCKQVIKNAEPEQFEIEQVAGV